MIRSFQILAVLAVTAGAIPAANAAKVIVLAVDGDEDGELEDGLTAIIEDRHDLVTSTQVEKAARKAHIEDLDGPSLGKIARKLGADAVVEGMMAEEEDGYSFTVRIRATSGKTVKKISVELARPRLSKKARKKLGTRILDGIDMALGIDAEEDEEMDEERPSKKTKKARKQAKKQAKRLVEDDEMPAELEGDDEGDEGDDDEDEAEADEDDDEDDDRVAMRDEMDDEDLDRALGIDKRGSKKSEGRDKPAFIVSAGPSAVMRTLTFASRPYDQAPTGYKSSMVPGARVALEAYPLALKSNGFLSGIGVGGEYDKTLVLSTASSDAPDVKLPTSQLHWRVDARFKFSVGTSADVTLYAGYGRRAFLVDRSGLPEGAELDMPDTDYRYYAPGLSVRIPIGERLGIHAGGEGLLFKAAGPIQRTDSYGGAKITGVEGKGGIDFVPAKNIIVDVSGSFTQIGFVFAGNGDESNGRDLDPTTKDVGGAKDVYIGVVGTVGYMY